MNQTTTVRVDVDDALALSANSDRTSRALVISWTYGIGVGHGVFRADDALIRAIEKTAESVERSGNDLGLSGTQFALGTALMCQDAEGARSRGLDILMHIRGTWLPERTPSLVPVAELFIGRERARHGDRETVLPAMRTALDHLFHEGRYGWCVIGTAFLVEALLFRPADDVLIEAEQRIRTLAELPAATGPILDVTVLRLRTLLARARDAWFGGDLGDLRAAWGRRTRGPRDSIRLGSYSATERLVRVHPALDAPWVPAGFVLMVLAHEALHHVLGCTGHPERFRAAERALPGHARWAAWERAHLGRLLRA